MDRDRQLRKAAEEAFSGSSEITAAAMLKTKRPPTEAAFTSDKNTSKRRQRDGESKD
jgi:hypothetical protein